MDAATLAHAYQQAGFTVLTTASTSWIMGEHRTALNVATLEDVFPTREEIRQVLSGGAAIVRFPTRADLEPNCIEFVLKADKYDLTVIKQKARNQTRRGLERCQVRPALEQEILTRGLEINHLVLGRQSRSSQFLVVPERWERYVKTFLSLSDVRAFVACVDGKIAAYMLTWVVGEKIVLVHPFLDRQFQNAYPINALVYTAINDVRSQAGPLPVSYGFESIWRIEALDHFKTGMGFEAIGRLRVTVFSGMTNLVLGTRLAKLVKALPVVGKKIGPKLQRLAEEKQVGLKWLAMQER